ncbi:unnamed protein product [Colias eurytheme]|nr:unnamed protein product [Colias eurytheme]
MRTAATAASTARPDFTSRGEDAGIGFGAIPVTKIIGTASAPQKRDATRSRKLLFHLGKQRKAAYTVYPTELVATAMRTGVFATDAAK